MNARNTVQDKNLGDRQIQAFSVYMGYAILLLVIASAAREFLVILGMSTLIFLMVTLIYAVSRQDRKEFARALFAAVCSWATTVAAVTIVFWVSPWSAGISAMGLSIVVGLSAIWSILAFGLLWQYNKLYPPAKSRNLVQFTLKATAIVASIGYVAIYTILWVFANDPSVSYGRWIWLAIAALAASLSLYELPKAMQLRGSMFALWLFVLAANIVLGILAWFHVIPFGREISIDWAVTLIACFGMIHAAWAGKTIDPNDQSNN